MTTSEPVAFGLGSNLGDREAQLRAAIEALRARLGPLDIASLYESDALVHATRVPATPEPRFLNTAVVAHGVASPDPDRLLALAKSIERAAGRRPAPRWAPRVLDIDLLVVGQRIRSTPNLTLPHAGLIHRRFVLLPLVEIAPDLAVPDPASPGMATSVRALERALAARDPGPTPRRRDWSVARYNRDTQTTDRDS